MRMVGGGGGGGNHCGKAECSCPELMRREHSEAGMGMTRPPGLSPKSGGGWGDHLTTRHKVRHQD